jgi:hypothetical protein
MLPQLLRGCAGHRRCLGGDGWDQAPRGSTEQHSHARRSIQPVQKWLAVKRRERSAPWGSVRSPGADGGAYETLSHMGQSFVCSAAGKPSHQAWFAHCSPAWTAELAGLGRSGRRR